MSKRISTYIKQNPVAGDSALGATSANLTRLFNLGTAAGANLTTSATDTTAGRVTRVGDGGLLSGTSIPSGAVDLNDRLIAGFYGHQTANNPANHPESGQASSFIVVGNEVNRRLQILGTNDQNRFYMRTRNASLTWLAWRELHHTGNYPSDTAWTSTTTLLNGWTGTVRYIKRAGMVTVIIEAVDGTVKTDNEMLELPAAYRPSVAVRGALFTDSSVESLGVGTTGNVLSTSTVTARGSVTYPVIT